MKITDEMIEAARREYERVDGTYVMGRNIKRALEAALAVAPEKGDLSEVIAEVLEAHVGRIGTHYEGCWKYHAVCLALLLRKAGVVAPPKNEGENSE